jgi:hypothetical protein
MMESALLTPEVRFWLLELDAGCDNDEILNRCRNAEQPHIRGCRWWIWFSENRDTLSRLLLMTRSCNQPSP